MSIKISDRAKMDPNASEREVIIMGNHGAVKLAEAMVSEKHVNTCAHMLTHMHAFTRSAHA